MPLFLVLGIFGDLSVWFDQRHLHRVVSEVPTADTIGEGVVGSCAGMFQYPYTPCMEYMPTLTPQTTPM